MVLACGKLQVEGILSDYAPYEARCRISGLQICEKLICVAYKQQMVSKLNF